MYGIKISNTGVDVGTADPRTTSMRSDFNMFKVHSDGTAYGTIQSGQQLGTVTFTHNLGYVPAFWMYYISTSGKQRLLSYLPEGVGALGEISAYAGTGSITCIYDLGYPYNKIGPLDWTDAYENLGGIQAVGVGRRFDTSFDSGMVYSPVIRLDEQFGTLVDLPQGATIGTATVDIHVQSKGTNTADGTLQYHGIDEDNRTSISDLGGAETTAGGTQNVANIAVGESFSVNVTSAVQEIVDRPGWSSGNGMGFHIRNVNFPNEKWFLENNRQTRLSIWKPGSVTFGFRALIFKDKII